MRFGKLTVCALISAIVMMFSASALAYGIMVKEGSTGADVVTVQALLKEKGFFSGEEDGVCGKDTVEAIKKFQASEGLEVDGICGPQTYRRLDPYDNEKDIATGRPLYVHATAYSPEETSGVTAMGTAVRKGIIASDPSVIPMGTRVYIPGYGEAVAEDCGGSIVGTIIDIAFDTHAEALAFGRQDIEIYILD
ncbi:3D domain protein [Anaerovibrio sp. JC8]|uniref:peptidoglycan-binding protein n=1 Tax=Anaerovibrio sp. JC8 TaxID=1240085 RepID=UPI000A0A231B|nr:peptidoglycan-binding protein [Anaerovibrio sp. JC8]ORU01269.1 3D domain protein [Anaerovibrio sp. JC8]